jgi:hypothetical protein
MLTLPLRLGRSAGFGGISIRLLPVRVALEDLVLLWAELDMN